MRIGSTNKKADTLIINELRRQNFNRTYDEEIYYNLQCENLSKILISSFIDRYGDITTDPLGILMRDKYVNKINGNCYPSVGAVLLFCEELPDEFEYASISISSYEGSERASLQSTISIKNGFLDIVPRIINEIKKTLWTNIKIKEIEREDQLEIPELALREAVINSIYHRDYSIIGASTKIDIFVNRLEIISPGNLPVGITLEELGEGASEIRNKVIAKAFRRLGYIEKLGTGISRMIFECNKAGLPPPVFEEPGRFFKVTFYRTKSEYSELEEKVISEIKKAKEIKAKYHANKLKLHPNTILNYLKVMIDNNVVEKIGKGPNVRYKLKL